MNIRHSDEVVVPVIKKYYGIGNFKVVGINSSLAELEALGFNYRQEPSYKVEMQGKMWSKLVFYVRNEALNLNAKLEFLLSKENVVFQNGKQKFINDLGKESIGVDLEECLARTGKGGTPFFKNINARPAKEGEAELLNFLINWFNIKNFVTEKEAAAGQQPDTVVINFDALVAGNVSELRGYLEKAKNNEVKLMLTIVNDYSVVYNRYFDRATANLNNFRKYVTAQESAGYPPKGDYIVGDLVEYKGSAIKPDADAPTEVPAF